jgi:hypothetical protein
MLEKTGNEIGKSNKIILKTFKKWGLLKLRLLDTQLVDTFWPIQPVLTFIDNCWNLVNPAYQAVVKKSENWLTVLRSCNFFLV